MIQNKWKVLLTVAVTIMTATTIAPVFAPLGVGAGTFQPANNSIIMSAVDREHLGTASAVFRFGRQVRRAEGFRGKARKRQSSKCL